METFFAIYVFIGMLIVVGHLHIIFSELNRFHITGQIKQLIYIFIIVMVWPIYLYYFIKNRFK